MPTQLMILVTLSHRKLFTRGSSNSIAGVAIPRATLPSALTPRSFRRLNAVPTFRGLRGRRAGLYAAIGTKFPPLLVGINGKPRPKPHESIWQLMMAAPPRHLPITSKRTSTKTEARCKLRSRQGPAEIISDRIAILLLGFGRRRLCGYDCLPLFVDGRRALRPAHRVSQRQRSDDHAHHALLNREGCPAFVLLERARGISG